MNVNELSKPAIGGFYHSNCRGLGTVSPYLHRCQDDTHRNFYSPILPGIYADSKTSGPFYDPNKIYSYDDQPSHKCPIKHPHPEPDEFTMHASRLLFPERSIVQVWKEMDRMKILVALLGNTQRDYPKLNIILYCPSILVN